MAVTAETDALDLLNDTGPQHALWQISAVHRDEASPPTRANGTGTITLPADHTRAHVRLGYASP